MCIYTHIYTHMYKSYIYTYIFQEHRKCQAELKHCEMKCVSFWAWECGGSECRNDLITRRYFSHLRGELGVYLFDNGEWRIPGRGNSRSKGREERYNILS